MELKPSPDPRRAEDATWYISADTRQDAREADACIAYDDFLYAAPGPPPPQAEPRSINPPPPPTPLAR